MNVDHIKMLFDIGELNSLFINTANIESFLQKIVTLVSEHMLADVCSIYLYNKSTDELVLKATKGLNTDLINKVKLKNGEGLVGTALKELRAVSEAEGSQNPQYKYIPDLHEEEFQSFLAVPLLQGNYKIGVLVIQRKAERPFTSTDVLALRTISVQLASMLANAKALAMPVEDQTDSITDYADDILPKMIKGKVASEGYAYSRLKIISNKNNYLTDNNFCFLNTYTINDFKEALITTENQLEDLQKKVEEKLSDAASLIFSAHLLILKDKQLIDKITALIQNNVNPPDAIIQIFTEYRNIFLKSTELIIQEKTQDLDDLATRIIDNLLSKEDQTNKFSDHIVITREVFPSELLKLSAENISGLIMVGGGVTSHISILARSLQLPMIIADDMKLMSIPETSKLLMDAHIGNIYINPTDEIVKTFEQRNEAQKSFLENQKQLILPATTEDKIKIKILANINLLSDLKSINTDIIDGIGLYRTEFPFLIRNNFPSEEEQFIIYRKLIESLPGKPITFRTLDIGGDKVLSYYDKTVEQNPFLGMRSIRFSLTHMDIFKQQIRAILRASAEKDVKIMFPMISSLDEFFMCKNLINECQNELKSSGIDYNINPKIGVMIEMPSLLFIINSLAEAADFFSVGTNDLVQYTLAVDRTNEKVAHLYQPHHPAILRSMKIIADAAKKYKIELSICGDMAGMPEYIPFLLGIGIRHFSIGTTYIQKVKSIIRSLSVKECKKTAKILLSKNEVTETSEIIDKFKTKFQTE
ncbi:MAG: phosphoenolpyruvate--protein phosphotransferase [Spirochaetes bacterium]|nr:phosphoenolpyruvate--protein phosphotransferase [Spirochaetota bacterium]